MSPRPAGAAAARAPRRLRVGIVGCGALATYGYLPALARLGCRPTALVDPRLDFARSLAARFGVPRVAEDLAEVAPDLDAAIVAAPPPLHAALSLPLLAAGVHTLVEKPFAPNAADARRMIEAAAASGARLAVGHQRRFLFVNRWIEAAVRAGALGDLVRVTAAEGRNLRRAAGRSLAGTGRRRPDYWNRARADCGGGVFRDWGPHLLDTLLWWLGPVRSLDYRDDAEGGLEADARLELEFECGAAGVVELSRLRDLPDTIRLEGTQGSLEASLYRNELLAAAPESLRRLRFPLPPGAAGGDEGIWGPGGPGERLVADWLAAIEQDREPFVPGVSALPVAALMDRCLAGRRPARRFSNGAAGPAPESAAAAGAELRGKTVLVTGATGFIGGCLVERLVRSGVRVRAAVRRFGAAAGIARFPPESLEMREFDLAAPGADDDLDLDDLLDGCAVVFHLALDLESRAANLEGAKRLGAACARRGIRLVFTSSYTVRRPWPDGFLTEAETEPATTGGTGAPPLSANALCEVALQRLRRERGLEVVVLQPTIVYGPFSGHWTDRPAQALLDGRLVLPSPGDGICNAVQVEDVVSALLLAAVREEAVGETFLISGAEHPTWLEFHAAYARALGRPEAIRLRPREEIETLLRRGRLRRLVTWARRRPRLRKPLGRVKRAGQRTLRRIRAAVRRATRRRDGSARSFVRERAGALSGGAETLPSPRHLEEFPSRCRVRIDKARRLLGYEPAFDLARGMAQTGEYLRWAYGARISAAGTWIPAAGDHRPPAAAEHPSPPEAAAEARPPEA